MGREGLEGFSRGPAYATVMKQSSRSIGAMVLLVSGGSDGGTGSGRAEVLPRRVDPRLDQPYSLVFISVCVGVSV